MIVDGWIDWATRVDGVPGKVYSQPNSGAGIVCHSMEGGYEGSLRELLKPERQASWMFSLKRTGALVQHYPVSASTWASGNVRANMTLWSVEAEGRAGELLTGVQVDAMLRLCREWENHMGRPGAPAVATREGQRTVWQHNEVWDWAGPNAGPTACPSGRYDGFFALLAERNGEIDGSEDAVTRTEYEDLVLALFAGSEEHAGSAPYTVRPRAERLAAAMHRVQLRAAGTERSVADIAASAAAVAPMAIPDHRHEMSLVVAQTGGVKRS